MLEPFEQAWRSQDHRKKGRNLQQEIDTLLHALERERRRSLIIHRIFGLYTIVTTIAISFLFASRPSSLAQMWPAIAGQVIALITLAWLVRMNLKRGFDVSSKGASIRQTTSAALQTTNAQIKAVKLWAVAMLAILVLTALAMARLHTEGKIDQRGPSSLWALLALVVVFNGFFLWLKWIRKLRPRRRRLDEIFRDLES